MFRWLGEPLAVDLANTIMVVREGEEMDLLGGEGDLRHWLDGERDRLGDCGFAIDHLAEIRALRDAVYRLFRAVAAGEPAPRSAVHILNAASGAAPIAPQLTIAGNRLESRELVPAGEPLAQLLAKLARSAIEIVTGPDRQRLQVCEAPSCGMFYLGHRRWCCAACGNRARAARHYRRTSSMRAGRSTPDRPR